MADRSGWDDESLAEAARDGDHLAFGELFMEVRQRHLAGLRHLLGLGLLGLGVGRPHLVGGIFCTLQPSFVHPMPVIP